MILASFRRSTRPVAAFLALSLAISGSVFAGLSVSTAWEVNNLGSDTANSGGFRYGATVAAPSAPSVAHAGTGGTVAANTYYNVITYTDTNGETVISGETAVTTTGTTSTITTTSPPALSGAATWSNYFGTVSGGPYFPEGTGLTIGSNRTRTTTPPTTGTQPRGVDYSIASTTPNISDANAVANGTTTVTDASVTFTGSHVANVAKIGSSFYDIVSVTDSHTIVVDRTITTGTGLTIIIGGPFASPGQACSLVASGHIVYAKAGTYTVAGGTNNTAGNKFTFTAGSLVGYTSNRNLSNTDTPPVLDAGANSMTVMTISGATNYVNNLSITNSAAHTTVVGWSGSSGNVLIQRVSVANCATAVNGAWTSFTVVDCSDSGCGGFAGGNNNNVIRYTSSGGTAGTGLVLGNSSTLHDCIVAGQTGTATTGIQVGSFSLVSNCTVANSAVTNALGILSNNNGTRVENCVVSGYSGSGAVAYSTAANTPANNWVNNADYNNTTAYKSTIQPYQIVGRVQLSADPFVASGSGNFALNTTAGGGAACRAAGIPGAFVGLGTTTGYRDIGAVQHQAASGPTFFAR